MCASELHCARFTLTQDSREKYSGTPYCFILKPSTMQNIILTTVILASLAAVGDSLSCYICRSDRKPECAKTLDVEERSKADYISECDESQAPVGCKKIITNEYNYAMARMCVVCRSDRVSGCGETIDPKIVNDYGQECANTTVCDKRINMEFETLVIRQCGSEAANDEEYFSSKCKEAVNHKVCKCRENMCNGKSNVVSSLSVLASAVLVVMALVR